jgi:hypothetical protein
VLSPKWPPPPYCSFVDAVLSCLVRVRSRTIAATHLCYFPLLGRGDSGLPLINWWIWCLRRYDYAASFGTPIRTERGIIWAKDKRQLAKNYRPGLWVFEDVGRGLYDTLNVPYIFSALLTSPPLYMVFTGFGGGTGLGDRVARYRMPVFHRWFPRPAPDSGCSSMVFPTRCRNPIFVVGSPDPLPESQFSSLVVQLSSLPLPIRCRRFILPEIQVSSMA